MASIKNRKIEFEVETKKDNRWIIECLSPDERDAKRVANAYLSRPGVQAVKVTRLRSMFTGFTTRSVIYECDARDLSDADKMSVNSNCEGAPYCTSREDLANYDSRYVIRRMLKSFLNRHAITPSELIYSWQWQRKINDAGAYVNSAISVVGRYQADKTSPAERSKALADIVTSQERACREYPALRHRLAEFDANHPDQWFESVKSLFGEYEQDIIFMGAIVTHLSQMSGYYSKLTYVLSVLDKPYPSDLSYLLEGLCTDLLMEGDIIRELFPNYMCRGEFLTEYASFMTGDSEPKGELLRVIHNLRTKSNLRQLEKVLKNHLIREISIRKPFDHRDDLQDDFWLDRLVTVLNIGTKEQITFWGGAEVEEALSERTMFAHQDRLRRIGLHDAADALPVTWSSPFQDWLKFKRQNRI